MQLTDITVGALFDTEGSVARTLFDGAVYPWEALGSLGDFVSGLAEGLNGAPGWRVLPGGVAVSEGARIHPSAVINGPAVICEGAELRPGAFIRGKVLVCPGCVVGNSTELKNCVLMEGAKLPHYSYAGDSIIGKGAHLGAGAVISNLKLDESSVWVMGIDTGLRKFGAAVGDGAQIGCHAVLNPGSIIGKNAAVYPLVPFRGAAPKNSIVKGPGEVVIRTGSL